MNITHISVSRKSVWDQCKKLYYYQYHIKQESPEEEPFYFVYGKIVHKIAEEYVRSRGNRQLKEVTNDVLEGRIPIETYQGTDTIAPDLPFEYKMRLPEHLGSIKKITDQIGYDGELEWPFEYDLDPPNNKKVVGFIDRLIKKGDQFWIIDYKTTKKGRFRKNKKTIKNDLQLRAYARIVQKHFGAPAENIRAALYYLEGGELIGVRFTENSLIAAERELLNAYNDIAEFPADKAWGTVGWHCTRCAYRSICPFYKNGHVRG